MDTDTDTESPNTATILRPTQHTLFPREDDRVAFHDMDILAEVIPVASGTVKSPDTPSSSPIFSRGSSVSVSWNANLTSRSCTPTGALLPPLSAASQRYNFRQRPHSLPLPEHKTQLSNSNFLIRLLYTRTLINSRYTHVFSLLLACVMSSLLINEYCVLCVGLAAVVR